MGSELKMVTNRQQIQESVKFEVDIDALLEIKYFIC
jgi:hypothetical protein